MKGKQNEELTMGHLSRLLPRRSPWANRRPLVFTLELELPWALRAADYRFFVGALIVHSEIQQRCAIANPPSLIGCSNTIIPIWAVRHVQTPCSVLSDRRRREREGRPHNSSPTVTTIRAGS